MFTIKHITPMGNETLYPTTEVAYSRHAEPPEPRPGYGIITGSLWYASTVTGQLVELRDGSVYVMNDHGSTVAKYDLGGWPQPALRQAA